MSSLPNLIGELRRCLDEVRLPDADIRNAAATQLGKIGRGAARAIVALIAGLKDDDRGVRAAAAEALGEIGPCVDEVRCALREATKDNDADVQGAATAALQRIETRSGE